MPNVKVLLNEKVEKLGEIGEIVAVKPGYARNFLLPQGLATIPTLGEVKRIQKKKELLEKGYKDEMVQAQDIAKKLQDVSEFTIYSKAGEAGKLFGRITTKEVSEKIKSQIGVDLPRKQILLKRAISELGEYQVKLKLHQEITTEIKLVIKGEEIKNQS